eukprot:GILK01018555.1.p1 GENE.GILK01018555.1~~GILK01018555.1.p1  ORF type:complete len:763 (+),score=87.49 GILK01018555.1:273-2561(+)
MSVYRLKQLEHIGNLPSNHRNSQYSQLLVQNLQVSKELRHENTLNCVFFLKFNHSGSTLACSTSQSQVDIWNPATGRLLHSLNGHREIVTSIIWLKDDSTDAFCSASLDKTIRLWRNYKPVHVLRDHRDWIRSLGLSHDNRTLVSGCVSSKILGWDLPSCKVIFRLDNADHHQSHADINTVNSLDFSHHSSFLFASGIRDGFAMLWDTRTPIKPVLQFRAHKNKLNSVCFGADDLHLLTSGRDSAIRLWDIRCTPTSLRESSQISGRSLVREYSDHACSGYNVSCQFMNEDRQVVTGSEDKKVYIYDVLSGASTMLPEQPAVTHAVQATDSGVELMLATSAVDHPFIRLWTPSLDEQTDVEDQQPMHVDGELSPRGNVAHLNWHQLLSEEFVTPLRYKEAFAESHRHALEEVMNKYGDLLLQTFHRHNFPLSNNNHFPYALTRLEGDQQGSLLLKMVRELAEDFSCCMELYRRQLLQSFREGNGSSCVDLKCIRRYIEVRQQNRERDLDARLAALSIISGPSSSLSFDETESLSDSFARLTPRASNRYMPGSTVSRHTSTDTESHRALRQYLLTGISQRPSTVSGVEGIHGAVNLGDLHDASGFLSSSPPTAPVHPFMTPPLVSIPISSRSSSAHSSPTSDIQRNRRRRSREDTDDEKEESKTRHLLHTPCPRSNRNPLFSIQTNLKAQQEGQISSFFSAEVSSPPLLHSSPPSPPLPTFPHYRSSLLRPRPRPMEHTGWANPFTVVVEPDSLGNVADDVML